MDSKKMLTVIREQVDGPTALQNVREITGGAGAIEQKLAYPYFQFAASCSVPTMVGRQGVSVDCLVDGINGQGATADPLYTEQRVVPVEDCLQVGISIDDATRIAHRTVTHQLGRKMRMIAPFNVKLESTGIVHRFFWIVWTGDGRIMIDSVTGSMYPLSASAA
jgi:hypothetical protein